MSVAVQRAITAIEPTAHYITRPAAGGGNIKKAMAGVARRIAAVGWVMSSPPSRSEATLLHTATRKMSMLANVWQTLTRLDNVWPNSTIVGRSLVNFGQHRTTFA